VNIYYIAKYPGDDRLWMGECLLYSKSFALFILAIVLSVLLRFTDSDCPFGIFKFFLQLKKKAIQYDLCTPIRKKNKTGGEPMCSGRVGCSCFTSGTSRIRNVQFVKKLYYFSLNKNVDIKFCAHDLTW
jgi:hypothetical protein